MAAVRKIEPFDKLHLDQQDRKVSACGASLVRRWFYTLNRWIKAGSRCVYDAAWRRIGEVAALAIERCLLPCRLDVIACRLHDSLAGQAQLDLRLRMIAQDRNAAVMADIRDL